MLLGYARVQCPKRHEIAESVLSGRKCAEMTRLYNVSQPTASRIVADYRAVSTLAHGMPKADNSSEKFIGYFFLRLSFTPFALSVTFSVASLALPLT